ncbi:hypothetical protein FJT64_021224 [Amphibalanus amphitrite]|uniref:Integrase catalytic domain-containing protein n=1 Tax=Amphibalanus amphitrite TaxID=1232801 RepID=A0A6A4WUX8_AMPAM|nr:hypothetical protein FJT64_021224 [Amphibalanus amphitrite]
MDLCSDCGSHRKKVPKRSGDRVSASAVSQSVARTLPVVWISVDGRKCRALVDTGCTDTLVHAGACSDWSPRPVNMMTVNGGTLRCLGIAEITVQHRENRASLTALFVPDRPLGMDVLLDSGEWTVAWKWTDGEGPDRLNNTVAQYKVPDAARPAYDEELELWAREGWLQPYDERVDGPARGLIPLMAVEQPNKDKRMSYGLNVAPNIMRSVVRTILEQNEAVSRGVLPYVDDLLVNEDVISAEQVAEHFSRYGLVCKPPQRPADGARMLGLQLTITIKLVKSDENPADEMTRVPKEWLRACRAEEETAAVTGAVPVAAAVAPDGESTHPDTAAKIRAVHENIGHQGVRRTLWYLRRDELLLDNATEFRGRRMGAFAARWGVTLRFRAVHEAGGNGIVERHHRTIKVMSARKGCTIAESLHRYNMTPRDGSQPESAPAAGVFRRVGRDLPVTAAGEHDDRPPPALPADSERGAGFREGDLVWVRRRGPATRCTDVSRPGTVTRIVIDQLIEVDGTPWHVRCVRHRHTGQPTAADPPIEDDSEPAMSLGAPEHSSAVGETDPSVEEWSCRSRPLRSHRLRTVLNRDVVQE